MATRSPQSRPDSPRLSRWIWLYITLTLGLGGLVGWAAPIPQDPTYHNFADQRKFFGIPNTLDTLSNLGFLAVGLAGLSRWSYFPPDLRLPLGLFWLGLALTALGSGYYHLAPDDERLFWDRLPITVAFLALFGSILRDRFRMPLWGLPILLAIGAGSLGFWVQTGDLSLYILIQLLPPLLLLLICALESPGTLSCRPLQLAIVLYAIAKVAEFSDHKIFEATSWVSGHTLKHLLAAAGGASLLVWTSRSRQSN